LSTRFETFTLDSGSALCFAQNGKGEESKEVRLFYTRAHLVGKGDSNNRSEKLLVLFHEKPCGCHQKTDNYLLKLLNNIIIQQ